MPLLRYIKWFLSIRAYSIPEGVRNPIPVGVRNPIPVRGSQILNNYIVNTKTKHLMYQGTGLRPFLQKTQNPKTPKAFGLMDWTTKTPKPQVTKTPNTLITKTPYILRVGSMPLLRYIKWFLSIRAYSIPEGVRNPIPVGVRNPIPVRGSQILNNYIVNTKTKHLMYQGTGLRPFLQKTQNPKTPKAFGLMDWTTKTPNTKTPKPQNPKTLNTKTPKSESKYCKFIFVGPTTRKYRNFGNISQESSDLEERPLVNLLRYSLVYWLPLRIDLSHLNNRRALWTGVMAHLVFRRYQKYLLDDSRTMPLKVYLTRYIASLGPKWFSSEVSEK